MLGTYFNCPGTPRSALYDGTVIRVGASTGCPYVEPISSNIDFDLTFTFRRFNRRHIRITVEGSHDGFPCYELIVNNKLEYKYDPLDYGQLGPNPFNLDRIVRGARNSGYIRNEGKRFSTVMNLHLAVPLPERPKKDLFRPAAFNVNNGF